MIQPGTAASGNFTQKEIVVAGVRTENVSSSRSGGMTEAAHGPENRRLEMSGMRPGPGRCLLDLISGH